MRSTFALATLFAAASAAPNGNGKTEWIPVALVNDETWNLMTMLYNEGSKTESGETPELHGELRMTKLTNDFMTLNDGETVKKILSFGWMAALTSEKKDWDGIRAQVDMTTPDNAKGVKVEDLSATTAGGGDSWKEAPLSALAEDKDHAEGADKKWKHAEAISEFDCPYNSETNQIQNCSLWVHYLRPFSVGNPYDLDMNVENETQGPYSMWGFYYWDTDTDYQPREGRKLVEDAPIFSAAYAKAYRDREAHDHDHDDHDHDHDEDKTDGDKTDGDKTDTDKTDTDTTDDSAKTDGATSVTSYAALLASAIYALF